MKKYFSILCLAMLITICTGTNLMAAESTYTVKAGDTLCEISSKVGTSADDLMKLNNLNSDFLQIGTQLLIQLPSQNASDPASLPTVNNSTVYYVQSGDNLWTIARKYGMTVARLMQNNNLTSDSLSIGQCLKVETAQPAPTPSRSGNLIDGLRIIEKAQEYLGTAYRYGGTSPGGFDCSGFVRYIFAQFGFNLPHNAAAQFNNGTGVEKSALEAGDLVFFACSGSGIDHVGIYSGDNQFIHSSSPRSGGVIYSSLVNGYYAGRYAGAKRILR